MKYTILDTELNIAIAQFDTLAEASKFTSKYGPGGRHADRSSRLT